MLSGTITWPSWNTKSERTTPTPGTVSSDPSFERKHLLHRLRSITFLYKLNEGAAKKSYGLNVARLAEVNDTPSASV